MLSHYDQPFHQSEDLICVALNVWVFVLILILYFDLSLAPFSNSKYTGKHLYLAWNGAFCCSMVPIEMVPFVVAQFQLKWCLLLWHSSNGNGAFCCDIVSFEMVPSVVAQFQLKWCLLLWHGSNWIFFQPIENFEMTVCIRKCRVKFDKYSKIQSSFHNKHYGRLHP